MRRLVTLVLAAAVPLTLALPGAVAADPRTPAAPVPSVIAQARAALDGSAQQADRDVSMAMRDVFLARPDLSPAGKRQADALLGRPTDPESPDNPNSTTYDPAAPRAQVCGPHVCVTYVTSTGDQSSAAWAAQTLQVMETSWTREVDQLGYRAPASDGAAGGDARFDVYLADVSSQGYYGFCVPEAPVAGQAYLAQAYCILDNDMLGFPMDPVSSLRVTAAHEFFHAIQFNIDAAEDKWWMEATATWIEEQVAGDVNDNRQYLPVGQLGKPRAPLDTYDGTLAMYGNWIFVQRLAQAYGVDAIRQIWARLDAAAGAPDQSSIKGISSFLATKKTKFATFYSSFVEANQIPKKKYAEGSAYKPAPVAAKVTLTGKKRKSGTKKLAAPHLASTSLRITPGKGIKGNRKVLVSVDATRGKKANPVARVMVFKKKGSVSKVTIKLNKKGKGSKLVNFNRSKVSKIILLLSNASTRYTGCVSANTTWACGGKPKDDKQKFIVNATVR
ncbi:MXAN_6640 family putative metalloprotease [Nocardioides sp. LHG3406-4]|uniref:MXAN_6640 family putative metalloprotease n=1 Tax=Nocardioides sp. LHG3406-4 TaxID=2804575 RepID=UPI003CFA26B0